MKIGIIAGEISGDILASGLIKELKKQQENTEFIGIAGPLMIDVGCKSLYPMNKLSVMGIMEILSCYRELKTIQNNIIEYFLKNPPDLFIGVDAPDFNLTVERALKQAGIPVIHYVSPSVWAWRQYRIKKIVKSTDLMLTLFPFEKRFYDNFGLPVKFVGHTLADEIDLDVDKYNARTQLGIESSILPHQSLIALLPGSRNSEVLKLSKPFLDTAVQCQKTNPEIVFIAPLVTKEHKNIFEQQIKTYKKHPNIILINGQSRDVMAASDAVLLASGTASLEGMLLKKPMIACYKMSPITYWIVRKLAKVPYFSLPNLLSGEKIIEEIAQEDVNYENLTPKVLSLLDKREWKERLETFNDIHLMLRKNASKTAAKAVLEFLIQRNKQTN